MATAIAIGVILTYGLIAVLISKKSRRFERNRKKHLEKMQRLYMEEEAEYIILPDEGFVIIEEEE